MGASLIGGAALSGPATAHGTDDWGTPAWLLTDVWEMADREPSGEEPTDPHSHVPIYYIAPDAAGYGCAQVTKDFSDWETLATFADGEWGSVPVDQTLHDLAGTEDPPKTEFTTLWHEHFVFDRSAYHDKGGEDLVPNDLVNGYQEKPFINSGYQIRAAQRNQAVEVVSVPMVFNCPARPAQGRHLRYCSD